MINENEDENDNEDEDENDNEDENEDPPSRSDFNRSAASLTAPQVL
ncbi:MAG: hypothetical protein IKV15_03635 [Bacteroidaceae bacterium]|nr:hypothetical protein [Bacteroidaceae bacterium]